MKMIFAAALILGVALLPASAADATPPWSAADVTLGDGDAALHGTLITPGAQASGFDAVLILSGSGPTDRDGNGPKMKNDSLKMLAEQLGAKGIATLRVDKRGVAASAKAGPKEEDLRFETYIDDAKNWLALLKSQPGVKRIFIVGHSEGALIGAVVAQDESVAGYVSLAGASLPAADILRRQLRSGPNGEQALALAEPTLAKLEKGELDPNASPLLAMLFRASVQPYLISWFRYDPRQEIAKIPGRVAIVQGTTDIQVLMADAETLKAARPDAAYVVIEGMNHILKEAPEDRAANIATYTNPGLPLAPGIVDAVANFVQQP